MSSIVMASVPVHGHVTPLLSVARGFVQRGDDVRFITGDQFAERVSATGATHIALPHDADFDDTEFRQFPERAKLKGIKAIAHDMEHVFARPAKEQYDTVMAALAAQSADAVLVDPAVHRRHDTHRPSARRASAGRRVRRASTCPA